MIATLVVARGDGTEILESVNRPLDDIAALVRLRIEGWRATPFAAAAQAMRFGVFSLRTDATDAASLNQSARLASAISTIDTQARGPLSRSAAALTRNGDGIEHGFDLGDIGNLAGRHDDRQGTSMAVDTQMQFACAAAA